MQPRTVWWLIVGLAAMAGCSRQDTTACEPDTRYTTARSAPPVQIPDDLSPPDESDALRLPPDVGSAPLTVAGECLEAPPSFFGDSRPFRRGDEPEAPAVTPAEPADQAPAPDSDRVISN